MGRSVRILACRLGGALDLLAVFVGTGGQHRFVALHPFEAPDGVSRDGRVGVTDVRGRVHVVDRCGQVVFRFHFWVLR